jgi:hypothetical protein
MKHLKIYCIALLSLVALPSFSRAADTMSAGKVQAFIVNGDVQLVDKSGAMTPLKRGQSFEEGSMVWARKGGNALLVFSNGATMRVLEGAQLKVDHFQQAKFDEDAEGTFLRLGKDPSRSDTQLDLRNGTLQGEVKQLNTAAGSKFTVNTPAGSAGIRGTIVSITVVRDSSGNVTGIFANCTVGTTTFTPSQPTTVTTANGTTTTVTNTGVDVGAGGQIAISLTTVNGITTGSVTGANLSSADAQAEVNEVFAALNAARAAAGLPPATTPTVSTSTTPVTVNGQTVQQTVINIPPTTVLNGIAPASNSTTSNGGNTNSTSGPQNPNTNPTVISGGASGDSTTTQ